MHISLKYKNTSKKSLVVYLLTGERKMISKNVYLRFDTFDSEQSVLNFIKEEQNFHSNSKTWKSDIEKLLRYKNNHLRKYDEDNQYRNIYGYYLKILVPTDMKKRVDEFAKKTMVEIDRRFLRNLYVYQTIKQGRGIYIEIICFSRYVLKRVEKRTKTYKRDYYYDFKTMRLCKKDNPNAVLKSKKGEPVLDQNGKKQFEIVEVKQVEDRIFVYKTIQKLTERLKKAVIKVIKNDKYHFFIVSVISRITVNDNDSDDIKRCKQRRNQEIKKINAMIRSFVDHMILGKFASEDEIGVINEEWCLEVDEMTHHKNSSFNEIQQYLVSWWNKNIIEFMF